MAARRSRLVCGISRITSGKRASTTSTYGPNASGSRNYATCTAIRFSVDWWSRPSSGAGAVSVGISAERQGRCATTIQTFCRCEFARRRSEDRCQVEGPRSSQNRRDPVHPRSTGTRLWRGYISSPRPRPSALGGTSQSLPSNGTDIMPACRH